MCASLCVSYFMSGPRFLTLSLAVIVSVHLFLFFLFLWLLCDMSLVRLTMQQLLFLLSPSPIVPIYMLLSDRGHVQCHLNHAPSVATKAVSLSQIETYKSLLVFSHSKLKDSFHTQTPRHYWHIFAGNDQDLCNLYVCVSHILSIVSLIIVTTKNAWLCCTFSKFAMHLWIIFASLVKIYMSW